MKYYYPLKLKTNLNQITISDNVTIRKITNKELERFFGMQNRKLNKQGHIVKTNSLKSGIFPYGDVMYHIISNLHSLFSSNYVLETLDNKKIPEYINLLVKLLFPGSSGICVGFNDETPSIYFYQNPYWKSGQIANIKSVDIGVMTKQFEKLSEVENDKKMKLVFEYYLNALSGEKIPDEIRFLNLMTILEILYLEDGKQGELSYRLALRIAKMFELQYSENPSEIYNDFKNNTCGLYKIRSDIIHSGQSNYFSKNKAKLFNLIEYVRKSILLYLDEKSLFSLDNLDNLVLNGEHKS